MTKDDFSKYIKRNEINCHFQKHEYSTVREKDNKCPHTNFVITCNHLILTNNKTND